MARRRVSVDPEEWEALLALRDRCTEDDERARLRVAAAEGRYRECLSINREQVDRLARMTLELEHARAECLDLGRRLAESEQRARELEPARLTASQPLFAPHRPRHG